MTDKLWESVLVIATGIIGVAIVAVILSKNAQTPQVLQAAGQSFGGILGIAISPVTGSNNNIAGILNSLAGNAGTNPLASLSPLLSGGG